MIEADIIRLRHMLDAAHESLAFVEGRTREELNNNRVLALALVKELEILGEAASNVSFDVKASMPEIPWAGILGMKERLAHSYVDVNLDFVWTTIASSLPDIARSLQSRLAEG